MPILSSQCSADPDVSCLSASRNISRLRSCMSFCIWCIMVSFHISSIWALSCLKEHLPLQSSFSCASTKTQQLPWAVIMLLHRGLTWGFWPVFASSFENVPWNLLASFIWKRREVISSFLMQENLLAAVYGGHELSCWQWGKEMKGNLGYNTIIFIALQWFVTLQNGVNWCSPA